MTSPPWNVIASFRCHDTGRRNSNTVNGTTTNYSWDPTGLGTVLSDGTEYLWGQGLIGQIAGSGATTYAHSDGRGSIRLLTDGSDHYWYWP